MHGQYCSRGVILWQHDRYSEIISLHFQYSHLSSKLQHIKGQAVDATLLTYALAYDIYKTTKEKRAIMISFSLTAIYYDGIVRKWI